MANVPTRERLPRRRIATLRSRRAKEWRIRPSAAPPTIALRPRVASRLRAMPPEPDWRREIAGTYASPQRRTRQANQRENRRRS